MQSGRKRCTKIVCTLGPASGSPEMVQALVDAGMNVARINCSHGDRETRLAWAKNVQATSTPSRRIGILVDLQGPKFRLEPLESGSIDFNTGETLTVGSEPGAVLPIKASEIVSVMEPGDRLLLGDGDVEILLGPKVDGNFSATALSTGTVKSRQGVTLRGKVFDVPALTPKDREDVKFAVEAGADFVALSYVNRAKDLLELRAMLDELGSKAHLCAKIETRQAVENFDEIAEVADLIMVARGDLGLQMDTEDVPLIQKQVILRSNTLGIPVITATQMLESMVLNARPTRAEATDVANAILDGTDAVMLSGETATGRYPVETVATMARIAVKTESAFPHFEHQERLRGSSSTTSAVAEAAVQLSTRLRAKAILCTSSSGLTARMVSKFRPRISILCTAWNPVTQGQLSVVWGVESLCHISPETTDSVVQIAIDSFRETERLCPGDCVIITAGVPAGIAGGTNMIWLEMIQ